MSAATETIATFPCFGARAAIFATGGAGTADRVQGIRGDFERAHRSLTRFDETSELSLLNGAPGARAHVSELMARFVLAAVDAARRTFGLVDPTLVREIETAGYTTDLHGSVPLSRALGLAPKRQPARPSKRNDWRSIDVDPATRVVTRPPGLKLDSGGVAKGMLADIAGEQLDDCESYAVDCCGDLRIGGSSRQPRIVNVDDPFGRGTLHEFEVTDAGVATSGIGRRSWIDDEGLPAHHMLDPSTGRPAYTGLVQVTALAPTAADAEVRAKAALLSGPRAGRRWLSHGGVLVFEDGSHRVIAPREVDAR
jgi:thiamine biosynthesis lipoprotein